MILSASRRTDIPAFYTKWFMNRIREGFVTIANPFQPTQVRRICLDPGHVDAIVFWTRNAGPLMPHLDELDHRGFRYVFQYTLVHYPETFESSGVALPAKIEAFKRLSDRVGPEKVIWRYDPIILGNVTNQGYHEKYFEQIAMNLRGSSRRCVISFLDVYRKIKKSLGNLKKDRNITVLDPHRHEAEIRDLSCSIATISHDSGLDLSTCAEHLDLNAYGIHHGKCIDDTLLNRIFGLRLALPKDKGQRRNCRCVESTDIGAYDTCPYGCIYCYANRSCASAKSRFFHHNSSAQMLG